MTAKAYGIEGTITITVMLKIRWAVFQWEREHTVVLRFRISDLANRSKLSFGHLASSCSENTKVPRNKTAILRTNEHLHEAGIPVG